VRTPRSLDAKIRIRTIVRRPFVIFVCGSRAAPTHRSSLLLKRTAKSSTIGLPKSENEQVRGLKAFLRIAGHLVRGEACGG
jgi:hypothetical protein